MGRIKKLEDTVCSSIRSDAVLFDFTRVVEELIFNSIDAGCTKVLVSLGVLTGFLSVEDDGCGISREDLVLLGERFASSKIHSLADTNDEIEILGSRGEALSSLSDVSVLEIITKTHGTVNGFRKVLKGHKCLYLGIDDTLHDVGTRVVVRELFHNQPVRRIFLQTSLKRVEDSIKRSILNIALVHPQISFKVVDIASEKELLSTRPYPSPLPLVSTYFGKDACSHLHEVNFSKGSYKLSGYISGPKGDFSTKVLQHLYIRSRLVGKCPIQNMLNNLRAAVEGVPDYLSTRSICCTDKLNKRRAQTPMYPAYILDLCCPISDYKLLYESSRTVVEFKDWPSILSFIEFAVRDSWAQCFSHTSEDVGFISSDGRVSSSQGEKERTQPENFKIACSTVPYSTNQLSCERVKFTPYKHLGRKYSQPSRIGNDQNSCLFNFEAIDGDLSDERSISGEPASFMGKNPSFTRWNTDFDVESCTKRRDGSTMFESGDMKNKASFPGQQSKRPRVDHLETPLPRERKGLRISSCSVDNEKPLGGFSDDWEQWFLQPDEDINVGSLQRKPGFFFDDMPQNQLVNLEVLTSISRSDDMFKQFDWEKESLYWNNNVNNKFTLNASSYTDWLDKDNHSDVTSPVWHIGSPNAGYDDSYVKRHVATFRKCKNHNSDEIEYHRSDMGKKANETCFPVTGASNAKGEEISSFSSVINATRHLMDDFLSNDVKDESNSTRFFNQDIPLRNDTNNGSLFHTSSTSPQRCSSAPPFYPGKRKYFTINNPALATEDNERAVEISKMYGDKVDKSDGFGFPFLRVCRGKESSQHKEHEPEKVQYSKYGVCDRLSGEVPQIGVSEFDSDHPQHALNSSSDLMMKDKNDLFDDILDVSSGLLYLSSGSLVPELISKDSLGSAKVLQQVDRKFIPISAGGVLSIIDQHAADERIQLEKLRDKVLSGEATKITYLEVEEELGLPDFGFPLLEAYNEKIRHWGWLCNITSERKDSFEMSMKLFHQDQYRSRKVTLAAVPCILGNNLTSKDLLEFLQQLAETDGSSTIPPAVHRILNFKACRGAIMFGDALLPSECSLIVQELNQTSLCFQCAHGRPTTIPLVNLEELHAVLRNLSLSNASFSESWHGVCSKRPSLERSELMLRSNPCTGA